jgi:SAM-dependent methyltransferase
VREANLFIDPIPFPDNEFEFVTAFDFIEYVPRVLNVYDKILDKNIIINPFINLMNEIYRILKDDGIFLSKTPAYPNTQAFQDPTHINIITEDTFPVYFNDHYPVAHIYGFNGGFKIKKQYWDTFYLVTELIKSPKPDLSKFNSY